MKYRKRSQLKNSTYRNISISEQLTRNTLDLLETTRTVVGDKTKVYTNNCTINLKFNNRKYSVRTYKDIQFLAKKIGYMQPLPPPGLRNNASVPHANFIHPDPGNSAPFSAMNTTAACSMHSSQFNPYPYHNQMRPQGQPSHVGRGFNSVWNT